MLQKFRIIVTHRHKTQDIISLYTSMRIIRCRAAIWKTRIINRIYPPNPRGVLDIYQSPAHTKLTHQIDKNPLHIGKRVPLQNPGVRDVHRAWYARIDSDEAGSDFPPTSHKKEVSRNLRRLEESIKLVFR